MAVACSASRMLTRSMNLGSAVTPCVSQLLNFVITFMTGPWNPEKSSAEIAVNSSGS